MDEVAKRIQRLMGRQGRHPYVFEWHPAGLRWGAGGVYREDLSGDEEKAQVYY